MENELPEGVVILNELHIVEYMDPDGEIYKQDFSRSGDDGDLSAGKAFELAEWARAITIAPMVAELVHDFVFGEGDEDDEAEVGQ